MSRSDGPPQQGDGGLAADSAPTDVSGSRGSESTETAGSKSSPSTEVPTAPPTGTPASPPPETSGSRGHPVLVNSLIAITTVLLVVGMFSVWANRLLFSPDNWSNNSTQLLANPAIRSSTANYLVDQLYANVNVSGLLKSALPTQLQGLAGPAAGALRNAAVQGTNLALTRPRIQNLWAKANRVADQSFIAVVKGGNKTVGTKHGVVTLNLGSILDTVAARLGLPAGLSSKLPANIATLTVLKSRQLKLVQDVGNAIQSLALWLTIIVPVLYVLAVVLARGHRRRALMTIGFAAIGAGVVVILLRSILETQTANSLTDDASLRPTIHAVVNINTQILGQIAGAVIAFAVVLVAAAWFAGPHPWAFRARQFIAPFLKTHPIETFAIVLGVMVLIFAWDPIHATGTPAGIITFTVLALVGAEALRRETAREFPNAGAPLAPPPSGQLSPR
ncbi:MAG TPA: hypothetical protein VMD09_06920 [Solirubrobacteraceae bacterium]|nr:hypothetical protein [Solirubrobacteraceae bacterium]